MSQDILNAILSGAGVIISALCAWCASMLTKWLDSKIKDEKMKNFLSKMNSIITDAIMAVYQEFVEQLKKEGKFDDEAKAEAKQKAMEIINSQLTTEMKEYIQENYGDIEKWVNQKIESVIYELKNKYKQKVNNNQN